LLAQLVAAELGCDAVWTDRSVGGDGRATYGLPRWSLPVVEGRRVVIVDDAIAAGSATRATRDALLAAGAQVVGVGALLTTGSRVAELEREFGAAIVRVAHIDARLWAAGDCPLCRAGGAPDPPR
jgi:orotate phosphoribosyltransferase